MRCIFCKREESIAKSVEHIVPESLGNTAHILARGVVCDDCNRYFALKVEKPILDSGIFRFLRSRMKIPNKKRRIPVEPGTDELVLPEHQLTARFLGKIGLEALASRLYKTSGWESEIVDKVALDPIREFSRFGRGGHWPFSYRPLYAPDALFHDGLDYHEMLHEYDLLYTKGNELYIVAAIFGVEFALNLGGPELDGYMAWLKKHDFISPLYIDKSAEQRHL